VQPEVRGYIPISKKVVWASRASVGLIEGASYGDVVENGPSGAQPPSADRTKDFQLTFFRGFFSGGPNSNRGYPIRGVSPYDIVPFLTPEIEAGRIDAECSPDQVTGAPPPRCRTPTGGFTLWELSTEARINLSGPLSVAAFCDASDVSPQANDIRLTHLHLSCGAGGRYDTPAGPIRLDIGYRINGMQVLGGLTRDQREPDKLLGIPIAVAIGIGEAY
jgi:outer membrane protein assembly factor BamA